MPTVFIPFDKWSPGGSYIGEGWQTVTNLYPAFNAWRPWRHFAEVGAGVAGGPVTGRHAHVWASGVGSASYVGDQPTIFAGTTTKLFTVDPSTGAFTDISRAAAYTADPGGWRFYSVGNDIWAVNWVDVPQRRTNNAGNFADGVTSTFVPRARFGVTIREHAVLGNLSNAGRFQDELAWSDADNAVNFDPAIGTSTSLASSKRLTAIPGQLTGLVGGQYGFAFKRRAIFYLEYTGTSQVLRPEVLSAVVGTAYPSSIIRGRQGLYFRGPDGFYVIQGLAEPVKISDAGIDWFFKQGGYEFIGSTAGWGEDTALVGFAHPALPLIGWGLGSSPPSAGGTTINTGSFAAALYNYAENRWSFVGIDTAGGNRIPHFLEIPNGLTLGALAAFTWNGAGTSKYATLSTSSAQVRTCLVETRYRPANLDSAGPYGQTQLKWVLPVFSKTSAGGTALTPSVIVTPLLDPWGTPGTAETITAAQRNPVSGVYQFQIASRHFKIGVNFVSAEDFENFEGCWVDHELVSTS